MSMLWIYYGRVLPLTAPNVTTTLKAKWFRVVLLNIMTVAVKNDNKTPLVVPLALRRKVGFKSGQELEFSVSGGVITLAPKRETKADEYTPAERRAIGRGIAQSKKDYKEGRSYGPFETHQEFIAVLNKESAKLRAKRKTRPAAK
jgi:bifunctional DNA-binding transcriptional regulator/antitoxin component of YhaV-PrlF toxin-antitoxin module